MGDPTATLERENLSAMNAPAPQLDDPERPRAAMKFTYPSGSRPLEGYTIKRGVGRGGFGEVYFATSDAGKEVALKLIRRNLDVELRGVTQCLNLKHPNLIALYDIRSDDSGDQWVVMEYVSGESLEDVIERHPSGLPIEDALWWMRGVCAGVAYLHDHGIVHRDLKPGNIFSDEGTVKIGDYGLAKFISCSRRSGQTESVGTVHYMAPEIANGRYGREIDTYALGIILFEMLTGHVPFEGESVGEVLMKHLTAEPDLSVLHEPYRDIVKRALAKDPNVRIKSVGELIELLPGSESTTHFARLDATPKPQPQSAAPPSPPRMPEPPPLPKLPTSNVRPEFKRDPTQGYREHSSPIEEPIWKAISNALEHLRQRWVGESVEPISRGRKIAFVLVIIILLSSFYEPVAAGAVKLAIFYAIYYCIWVAFIRPGISSAARKEAAANRNQPAGAAAWSGNAATNDAQQTAVWEHRREPFENVAQRADQSRRSRRLRTSWRERANEMLIAKSMRQKTTELVGSMLLAAVVAAVAACAIPLMANNLNMSEVLAAYLWLTIVATLGSWAILVPSKFFEGKLEEQVPMRLTLLLLGAVIGMAAWYIADAIMLKMPGSREPIQIAGGWVSNGMLGWDKITGGANPPIQVYVAYFAFLFLLPRWWRQTEYTRGTRMSLWCVLACVFTAWLLHLFWWFPQPIGMIVAGVIALTTQLASPWMPPSQRRALSEAREQAVT
jgi:serine/threonine protein kinase